MSQKDACSEFTILLLFLRLPVTGVVELRMDERCTNLVDIWPPPHYKASGLVRAARVIDHVHGQPRPRARNKASGVIQRQLHAGEPQSIAAERSLSQLNS